MVDRDELEEALAQQAATSEILRIIAASPADTQPVFDAIVQTGLRFFPNGTVTIRLIRGDHFETAATTAPHGAVAVPLSDGKSASSRAVLRRETVQIPDFDDAPEWVGELLRTQAERQGWRALLVAPLLRKRDAIGVIGVTRATPGAFSDRDITLLETYASQAVIAIDNVRLFNEKREALDQQTATADILKVISSSPTDIKPVFEAILGNALRFCSAHMGQLYLYDGEKFHNVANRGATPEYLGFVRERGIFRPVSGAIWERAIAERRPFEVADLKHSSQYKDRFPGIVALVELNGARTHLSVPMLKDGRGIGVINIYRPEVQPFSQKQIDLVTTFAAQAVIAIENVRLFNETKEALEQQTATSEILRVISSSPTDLQPVFDSILENATHLCGAHLGTLGLFDGDKYEYVAQCGGSPEFVQQLFRGRFIPEEGTNLRRMLVGQEVVHVPDRRAQARPGGAWTPFFNTGARTVLCVPMVKESKTVGGIVIYRPEVRLFTQQQIELVKTFADQAVIAIENVRLFNETKDALEQQTVISEILRVISSSPTDTQPVFDAIVKSGVPLFGGLDVSLRLVKGNYAEMVASTLSKDAAVPIPTPLDDDRFPTSRTIVRREVIHIPDMPAEDWVGNESKRRSALRGFRAFLSAPLMLKGNAIGTIAVSRATPGPFTDKQVALLETFASQAVIAIENVRLFNELQARNAEITASLEQQTATAEILRVISSSPTDLQPVFDAILENATHLCDAHLAALGLYDGEKHEWIAQRGGRPEFVKRLFREPYVPVEGTLTARMLSEGRPVHIRDLANDTVVHSNRSLLDHGARTVLAVPMLKEGRTVGGVIIYRSEVRPFTQEQMDLVSTFASQAVIALENVRLFKETNEALEQLAEANRAKSRFLAAASHDLRQPVHALGLFVAQLQEARDPAVRERIIEKVEASTAAVSQLVEALLDISKLDQGTVRPQIADLALQPMLDRLEQAFSVAAQAKDLRFRLRPSALWVRTDSVLLERIVLNLVANAVRYTQEGGIVVGVRRRGTHARIEVRDTGIGISPEEQQHIFEEFYQAAGALDGGTKGLGLGLAIVDRAARLLGLTVTLRSTFCAGSVFAVEVPLATQQAVRIMPTVESLEAGPIQGLRVLLIDDDNTAREAAEGLLTQWGCEVVSASSGKQAYGLLSSTAPPAVIICDYRLGPHERGTDVVKTLRARLGTHTPAVIVSADSSATSFESIAAEGLHLLRKPLKAAQLRVLLHHVIAGANSPSETSALH